MPIIVNNHWTILLLEKKKPRCTNVLKYTVCLEFCAITCYYGTIVSTYTVYPRVFSHVRKFAKLGKMCNFLFICFDNILCQ